MKDILNSTVTDPAGQTAFTVSTPKKKDTVFSDKDGKVLAKVEWHEWLGDPTIDMKGVNNGKRIDIKKWAKADAKKKYVSSSRVLSSSFVLEVDRFTRYRRFMWNSVEFDWIDGPLDDFYVRNQRFIPLVPRY